MDSKYKRPQKLRNSRTIKLPRETEKGKQKRLEKDMKEAIVAPKAWV